MKNLLLGGFASGFLLFGMALISGETGPTQLVPIASALQNGASTVDPLLMAGLAPLFVGLAFQNSAAPFHTWTPHAHQVAPTSVTTFMSVTTKVAAFAALIRVFSYTLGETTVYDRWKVMVYFVAIASMVIGNVPALRQRSLKRVLGYSGIAQAGYILIGVVVLSPAATWGATLVGSSRAGRARSCLEVLLVVASRPANGDWLTENCIRRVGSPTSRRGSGSGFSASATVSPTATSASPEM